VSDARPLRGDTVRVGDRFSRVVVDGLTRTQLVMYAGASGDFHPFHHDDPAAQAHGYEGVFSHGMLTMGLTGQLLSELVGDAALRRYRADFLQPVFPGATLTAHATVTAVREAATADGATEVLVDLALETLDDHGARVLRGEATAALDPGHGA
jgi:acyl dehydratase